MSENFTDSPMLGTYTLENGVPVDPQIVLTNCRDTTMLRQLITVFGGNPNVRFFLIPGEHTSEIDPAEDIYFVRHNGNWVLSQGHTVTDVLFGERDFNPDGMEGMFSLAQTDDGSWDVNAAHLPPGEHLLVKDSDDDIFGGDTEVADALDAETFFIDPSVLEQGENEIVLNNFHFGVDTLALPDGLAVKNVIVDSSNDLTEVILEWENYPDDADIIVKLLGVDPANIGHEAASDLAASDDLNLVVQHIIDSGGNDLG